MMIAKKLLQIELLKQAKYQDLDVTDLKLENYLDWVIGTCKVNGGNDHLIRVHKLAEIETWVTSFLANFPNSVFNPVPKFRGIEKGICPDCNGKLSEENGYCSDCHIIPALDPDFQTWVTELQ